MTLTQPRLDSRTSSTSLLPDSRVSTKLGATPTAGGVQFALWSTLARDVAVRLFDNDQRPIAEHALSPQGGGIFAAVVPSCVPGALYKFVLDGRELPDPYARYLPFGVHGPARVEEPRFATLLAAPRPLSEWVIYELHVGTFTSEGTYRAASERLAHLAQLGVTAVELMPLASFDGHRGWGYDGVALYAPFAPYGEPDDLRAFIDAAHSLGLMVVLDVVYNHFGPAGNYLAAYAPEYFTPRHITPWGDGPDFGNPFLRDYIVDNARYWLEQFGFDGLRLDATHQINDESPVHVLRELADTAAACEPPRVVIAEDDRNDPRLVTELGVGALWADDFHHALRVVLTGERDGYYAAYEPSVDALARTIERGWFYEGQMYPTTGAPRGAPADSLSAAQLAYCIQNHDQIGNRALGDRLSAQISLDAYCAASMLLLFLPMPPLLFMGQEWAASTPFLFFTDHEPSLGAAITAGRRDEFKSFASFTDERARASIPDPQAEDTFQRSKLRWSEITEPDHTRVHALYRSMLAFRTSDPVLRDASRETLTATASDGVLRVERGRGDARRWLIVNFNDRSAELSTQLADREVVMTSGPSLTRGVLAPRSAVLLRTAT